MYEPATTICCFMIIIVKKVTTSMNHLTLKVVINISPLWEFFINSGIQSPSNENVTSSPWWTTLLENMKREKHIND